mgnify:CR=1 FL=1
MKDRKTEREKESKREKRLETWKNLRKREKEFGPGKIACLLVTPLSPM